MLKGNWKDSIKNTKELNAEIESHPDPPSLGSWPISPAPVLDNSDMKTHVKKNK